MENRGRSAEYGRTLQDLVDAKTILPCEIYNKERENFVCNCHTL